ncbi:MAG TPA: crossover junction endodeoxyribonuclease RuvC [Bacteroidetes bacterium]|nr:MAG: crossover junction endodeoxyribonuclease RuvC [Ignavibacteria bacterium GWA2_54_16]HCA78153.1 crossover junction endodeoxyribonuclease RuvC [Bacteroidota bacterium]
MSKNTSIIILGVDPGTLITGFGVIEARGGTVRVLEYDVVRNQSDQSMPIRLKAIYTALCKVIDRFHPDEFAIETAFYGKNAQSAMKLGHARGVSILAAVNYEIPTSEYSPREVKRSVAGTGAASKDQVSYMVQSILKLKTPPRFYDATDALAVALCHSFQTGGRLPRTSRGKKSHRSWSEYVQAHPEKLARPR